MKIGILTFTDGTNIGQRLQNYALQEMLKHYADEVYTIKQKEPYSAYKLLKMRMKKLLLGLKDLKGMTDEQKRRALFRKFNEKNIDFYGKKLSFHGDNTWITGEFDAFVVGSDQVWNPRSPYVGGNFFLEFARPEQRYTYAPSFSVEDLPRNMIPLYKKRLMGFSDISVREDEGAEIVKGVTGRKSAVVLDPTLLVEKDVWDKIKMPFKGNGEKDYVLCVFLGTTDIDSLRNTIKKDMIVISNTTPVSPAQFLDLVSRASLVLTDSYHVTIFSVIYHVPFINFERTGTKNDMSSRFKTLYRELRIKNRDWMYLVHHVDEMYDMDFKSIDYALTKEKEQSMAFLDRTIGKRAEQISSGEKSK